MFILFCWGGGEGMKGMGGSLMGSLWPMLRRDACQAASTDPPPPPTNPRGLTRVQLTMLVFPWYPLLQHPHDRARGCTTRCPAAAAPPWPPASTRCSPSGHAAATRGASSTPARTGAAAPAASAADATTTAAAAAAAGTGRRTYVQCCLFTGVPGGMARWGREREAVLQGNRNEM